MNLRMSVLLDVDLPFTEFSEVHQACVLTRRGFAMYIKLIAKPLAFALFTVSGSLLDHRVAFRSAREAAFGPSRRPTAGFRRLRWRAHLHQKRRNYPMDPYRRQPTPIVTAFPR